MGRRALLLTSLILMLPFLPLTGYFLDEGSKAASTVFILVLTALYSPGAGVIPFMYSSEIFPQKFREVGMSLAVAVNLSFAGALAMAVPQYQDILSGTDDEQQDSQHNQRNNQHLILLGCFAALDLVAVVLVWFFMRYPDEDVELENMNVVFGASTIDYVRYQIEITWSIITRKSERGQSFETWLERRLDPKEGCQEVAEAHEMLHMSSAT